MKIQYFPSDLSALLGIGTISNMFVETVGNSQVLRIECSEAPKDEYTTVRATKGTGKKPEKSKPTRGPVTNTNKATSIGGKAMEIGANWLKNKEKPNFMKDAGF